MIERREFLQMSALTGASVLIGSRTAFGNASGLNLEESTVASLQAAMASGSATSRQITEGYLARIAEFDKKLNSIIELNPDALAIADRCEADRMLGKRVGPLHGIPVLIKDNIDTADKMKTTAGSLALVDAPTPKQDAASLFVRGRVHDSCRWDASVDRCTRRSTREMRS